MNISKLLRFLLRDYLSPGIVEAGGGGAAGDEADPDLDTDADADAGADGEEDAGQADADADAASDDADGEGDTTDEMVVTIGGEEEAAEEDDVAKAPEWVRELRKSNREKDRRIRELEQTVAKAAPVATEIALGPEPTMDDEDVDYDADKFKVKFKAWLLKKNQADEQLRVRTQSAEQQQAQWQTRIDAIGKAASALKLPDYEDAAQSFEDLFPSLVQRGIIMDGPEDPKTSALLRYALGKNPKKAKELASITNPVRFAWAISKLEDKLKVTPRKAAPNPDTVVRSSVAGSAAVDSTLERLQAQADKSGDRTKVAAYIRQKRQKQAA